MAVDNVIIQIDLSALTYRVLWDNGKGFREPLTAHALRENFNDVTPYLSYINTFITTLAAQSPPILLDQAKQIKIDLLFDLFNVKRTAPITVSVTVNFVFTPHLWDASDAANAMMQYWIGRDPTFANASYWPVTLLPLDSPTPIPLGTELLYITDGIANRTNSLRNVFYSKKAAITALGSITAVVAYDVTAGW